MVLAAVDFEVEKRFDLAEGRTAGGVTAAGDVYGFWQAPDGTVRYAWNGNELPAVDDIARARDDTTEFWSDDGCHVAVILVRGEEHVVVRDGVEYGPYRMVSGSARPVFSAGGVHLAFGAIKGDEAGLIVDGELIAHAELAPVQPVYSRDGVRFAWVQVRQVEESLEYRVVVDDVPGDWFVGMRNAAGALQFSPDGARFAFYRIDGKGHGQWTVDGVPQRLVNDNRPFGFAQLRGVGVMDPPLPALFSPDGRRFAYEADVLEKGVAVVEDDVPGPALHAAGYPVFSPDSRHLAYLGQALDKRMGIVLDGRLGTTYEASRGGTPVFSPDSQHVAMSVRTDEGGFLRKKHRSVMLVDGEPIAVLDAKDASGSPAWSPDAREVAWWAEMPDGSIRIFRHAQELDRLESVASQPEYTISGRLVYAGSRPGGWTVMVDGRPGPLADAMRVVQAAQRPSPALVAVRVTPDGEHVAWVGQFGDVQRPVLDDQVGPGFDEVVGCEVAADGRVRWWAQRGTEVFEVTSAP